MEENSEVSFEKTKSKKFLKNIFIVLLSNILTLLTGVLTGFVIPKIMGITDYGYYKTFTLYASYIGLFHFGFVDGIYLYFAGKNYDELEKDKFRAYTRFLFLMETAVSFIVTAIAMCFVNTEFMFIFIFVAIDLLALNITTYYEFISQITMRFKQISIRSLIKSFVTIAAIVSLFFMHKYASYIVTYYIYAAIVIFIQYVLALWYIFSYREITFGKSSSIKKEWKNIKKFFFMGFPLLLANLVAQFIFLIDQQFVNLLFDTETYATYAFAYNLISLITVATSAISTVLYPTLKKMNEETIKSNYTSINAILLILVYGCIAIYFPLHLFINFYLPQYSNSLIIFRIILPGIAISSSISVIKFNCYKTFGKIRNYFIKSIIVLGLSFVFNISAYFIFKNTISISIVSIIVLLIWYLLTETYFIRQFKVKWIKNLVYLIILSSSFYLITMIENIYIAFSIYIVVFLIITIVMYYKLISKIFKKSLKKS